MWGWVLGILIALIALTAVVSAAVFAMLFRRSPEGRWRDRVLRQSEHAWRTHQSLSRDLREWPQRFEREERNIWEKAFAQYLSSMPVSALESYPGIGPVTIARIESAGYRSLADLQRNPNVDSHGLGDKRLADIAAAVRQSAKDAWARLQAGGCAEGQEASRRIAGLREAHVEREQQLKAQIEGCRRFLAELQPSLDAAKGVTPWRYVANRQSLLAPEILARPLPDLEAHLRDAPAQMPQPVAGKPTKFPEPAPVDLFEQARQPTRDLRNANQALDGPPPVARLAPAGDDLELFVQFAYAVARSDGRIARREQEVIAEYVAKRCGDDAVRINRAKAYCAHYETAAIDLERCLQALGAGRHRDDCEDLFEFAEAVADAAGPRNAREIDFLQRVAWALGLPESKAANHQPQQREKPRQEPERPAVELTPTSVVSREQQLAVLEIAAATPLSADLVRRQFRLLSDRYAPEKFASAGVDFIAMAEGKRLAVRAAAVALLEPFGEALDKEDAPAPPQELRHNPDLDAMFSVH